MKFLLTALTMLASLGFAEWHIETVDSESQCQFTSLSLGSSGNPHISYNEWWGGLKYAFWNGSYWEIEVVDSTDLVGSYNSLALDSSGNPHISYSGEDWNLKYAWQTETGIGGESDYPLELLPITPNPTSGTFIVEFCISECAQVGLCIYDMSGRLLRQTPATIYNSGSHQVYFSDLETGVYLCRMRSGDFTETQQFVVIE